MFKEGDGGHVSSERSGTTPYRWVTNITKTVYVGGSAQGRRKHGNAI